MVKVWAAAADLARGEGRRWSGQQQFGLAIRDLHFGDANSLLAAPEPRTRILSWPRRTTRRKCPRRTQWSWPRASGATQYTAPVGTRATNTTRPRIGWMTWRRGKACAGQRQRRARCEARAGFQALNVTVAVARHFRPRADGGFTWLETFLLALGFPAEMSPEARLRATMLAVPLYPRLDPTVEAANLRRVSGGRGGGGGVGSIDACGGILAALLISNGSATTGAEEQTAAENNAAQYASPQLGWVADGFSRVRPARPRRHGHERLRRVRDRGSAAVLGRVRRRLSRARCMRSRGLGCCGGPKRPPK